MTKPYGVMVRFTDGREVFHNCDAVDLDAEEGTLTLYNPVNGFLNVPMSRRVIMLRHILYYDVEDRT